MHRTLPVLGACCASLLACAAFAAPRLDVEIYDRTAGVMLPVYEHRGRRYVAGEPGHEYEIRMRNDGPERLLAVTSVDGVDVLSGRTAARSGGGYVLEVVNSAVTPVPTAAMVEASARLAELRSKRYMVPFRSPAYTRSTTPLRSSSIATGVESPLGLAAVPSPALKRLISCPVAALIT